MPLVINTNTTAASASNTLNATNSMLQKSLQRLSSGSKIINPEDDAGGLAVAMKMSAAANRNNVVQNNIGNALSFLQTQDGALKTTAKILDRMSELKMLHSDATKSDDDKANYQTEFAALQTQLTNLAGEKFNGVDLFVAAGGTKDVLTTEDGGTKISITQAGLTGDNGLKVGGATDITAAANKIGDVTIANLVTAIQNIATMRAQNGAESSQLKFSQEMLEINETNLRASISRIMDVDVAKESTNLTKLQILNQSGIAMLGQANTTAQSALRLIQ